VKDTAIVYILHEQANMDFSPAEVYGDVVFMDIEMSRMKEPSDRDQSKMRSMVQTAQRFRPDRDFVIFTGSPVVIATMGAIMGKYHPRFRTLRWDRTSKQYIPVTISMARVEEMAFSVEAE
jgi:hypothetical protein